MAPLSIFAALTFAVLAVASFTPPKYPSTVLKILCVIKPNTTMDDAWGDGQMNQTMINEFANGFLNIWPEYVYNITAGTVRYETSVVVSPDTLFGQDPDPNLEGMIEPPNVQKDIDRYNITVANYDHVIFIGSQPAVALWTFTDRIPDMGMTSLNYEGNSPYVQDWSAGNTHETLWALQDWFTRPQYMGTGQSPVNGSDPNDDGTADILNGEYYNYTADVGGDDGIPFIGQSFQHWTKWYKDFLNGQICMQDGDGHCQDGNKPNLGLGPNAWKWPSRRENFHGLSAGYLATSVTWPGEPKVFSTYTGGPTFDASMNDRPWTTGGGNWFGAGPNLVSPTASSASNSTPTTAQPTPHPTGPKSGSSTLHVNLSGIIAMAITICIASL